MSDTIRITKEETETPEVDSCLSEQRAFGFAAPEEPGGRQPLLFRPWFALMLAGALAGFTSWLLVEPGFDDGARLKGVVSNLTIDHDADVTGGVYIFYLGGVRVLLPGEGRVVGTDGRRGGPRLLRNGLCAELVGQPVGEDLIGSPTVVTGLVRLHEAGWCPDVPQEARESGLLAFLLMPLTASFIGLAIGATDGILSRAWRRAAATGAIGAGIGFLGGLVAMLPVGMIYSLGQRLAASADTGSSLQYSGGALAIQIMGRGLAWCVIGIAVGLGPGLAMKSRKLVANGLIGGAIGALLGGVLFDPLGLATRDLLATGGAELSRALGLVLVGAGTGFMIGLVEIAAREAWVRVLTGPLAGKEFVLYRDPTWIGSSPKCEVFLFKDAQIAPMHLAIRRIGEHYEADDQGSPSGTYVGNQRIKRTRLRDHDRIAVGQTRLEFRLRDE